MFNTTKSHFYNLSLQHTATQNLHELGKDKLLMERRRALTIHHEDGRFTKIPFNLSEYENYYRSQLAKAEQLVQSLDRNPNLHSAYITAVGQTQRLIEQTRTLRNSIQMENVEMLPLQDVDLLQFDGPM